MRRIGNWFSALNSMIDRVFGMDEEARVARIGRALSGKLEHPEIYQIVGLMCSVISLVGSGFYFATDFGIGQAVVFAPICALVAYGVGFLGAMFAATLFDLLMMVCWLSVKALPFVLILAVTFKVVSNLWGVTI